MKPYQQRVVEESEALAEKLGKLKQFISSNPTFSILKLSEKMRLLRQRTAMETYDDVLRERIEAFTEEGD